MAFNQSNSNSSDLFTSLPGDSKVGSKQDYPFETKLLILLLLTLLFGFLYILGQCIDIYLYMLSPLANFDRESIHSEYTETTDTLDQGLSFVFLVCSLYIANYQAAESPFV